jgi:hypothetical protein
MLPIFYEAACSKIMVIGDTLEPDATDLDWTVYGIAHIPGNHDDASWRADRGDGKVFVGVVGSSG